MAGGQGTAPEIAEERLHVKEAPAAVAATALLIREPEPVKGVGSHQAGGQFLIWKEARRMTAELLRELN